MKMVWIVLRNGKVDHVFDNPQSAEECRKDLAKRWNIVELIELPIFSDFKLTGHHKAL